MRFVAVVVGVVCSVVAACPSVAVTAQGGPTGTLEFDPGNGGVSGQTNMVGVDLNALYGVTQPFVVFGHSKVYAGEHYVPYSHLFVDADERDSLQRNLLYRKYVVRGDASFSPRTYVFDDDVIATTWDVLHDDDLTCSDFFLGACAAFGMTGVTAMVAWLPKLPPLPIGDYQVELIAAFADDQEAAGGTIPAGEWTQVVFPFRVIAGNRPKG